MKRFVKHTIIIGLIYLLIVFIISITIGLPPFNKGFVIGYPAMYYNFGISINENQHGFMGLMNVFINIAIICSLSFIYSIAQKNK
jgi:hypothetical protein